MAGAADGLRGTGLQESIELASARQTRAVCAALLSRATSSDMPRTAPPRGSLSANPPDALPHRSAGWVSVVEIVIGLSDRPGPTYPSIEG